MMPLRFLLLMVIVGSALPSCRNNGAPQGEHPDSAFVNLYADRLIIEHEALEAHADSTVIGKRIDSLFHVHHISLGEYNNRLENYKQNLPSWKQFYEDVIKRLDQLQQLETAHKQS